MSRQDLDTLRANKYIAQANLANRWAAIVGWCGCLLILAGVLVPVAMCGGLLLLDQLGILR